MVNRLFLLLGAALFITGCGPGVLYDNSVTFENGVWDKDVPAVFEMEHPDTSRVVDVGMTFMHDETYPFSNLWLFLEVHGPKGTVQIDTLEFLLAETDGQWLGKKKGDQLEVSALYQYGVKFSEAGSWSFKITQGMRHPQLEGIHQVAFWVQESAVNESEE